MLFKKKAVFPGTWPVYVVLIFTIVILLLIAGFYSSSGKDKVSEKVPNFSYQFPKVFVYSFLMSEVSLTEEEIGEFGLDENRKYLVRDLIVMNTDWSRELVDSYREVYLERVLEMDQSGKSASDYFRDFSKSDFDDEDLLLIDYEISELALSPEELYLKGKSYFFILQMRGGKFAVVYFRKILGGA